VAVVVAVAAQFCLCFLLLPQRLLSPFLHPRKCTKNFSIRHHFEDVKKFHVFFIDVAKIVAIF
jgi:hypothetical protein